MTKVRGSLLAGLMIATAAAMSFTTAANAADAVLSGTITSAAGEKLGGITVSAKPAGGTITTTVFTDETGAYYFPPLPAGKYRVWAQAVSFDTAKAEIDLSATRRQGFVLTSDEGLRSPVAGQRHARRRCRRRPSRTSA